MRSLRITTERTHLRIKPETTFAELSLDSLDVAELVMSLEDEFGVTIEMNENLKTVGDITKYIEEKLA